MMPQVTIAGEFLNSRMSGGIVKRATVAVLLSGLFALLTLGLSGCGSSTPPAIGVGLTPSGTKSIDQAQTVSITAAVSNDSKSAGVTWTVSGTNGSQGTLTNPTTTSVTYNTPGSVTSAFTATVTATSVTDTTKFAVLKITVSPLPSITTTSLAAATAGTAYSAMLVETGGTSPYTWTVTPATLPAGLSLNSSTGVISGMPTGGGSGQFTFKVTDAAGQSVSSQSITFTVAAPPALTVTTATLPAAVMGTAYSQTLQAAGGVTPYTWSVPPGTLPAGLTLNSSTGVISGTPTGLVTGTIPFTVTVTDVETPTHATTPAALSIAVSAPTLSVTTSSLPGGTMGNPYSQTQLTAKGGAGADTWKLAQGSSLPAGLILSGAGVITGTPSGNFVGPTNFTVVVTDSETPTAQTATAGLSIAITVAPLSVTTSGALPTGVANSVYPGVTLQPTGGIPPYINWSVVGGNTNLPPGLTLNAATGAISGTPTTAGTTTFTVTVTDSEATPKTATSATLSITVNPALSVTTNSLPAGVVGTVYPAGTALQAAGGVPSYTWAVTTGSLPAGLTLNASTGAITGKPTGPAVGTIAFTVTVTDSESPTKTATQSLSIVITAPQLTVTTTTASLPTGVLGNTYSTALAASGGAGAYTWAVTGGNASLPPGLTLNTATGVISGTPTATGQTTFTVTVTDSETPTEQTASASLTISVNNSAPLAVTTTSSQLPTGVTGTAYPSTTLQASGGVTPYTWSISGNPSWLSISPSGVLSGTPNATGTFSFTAKVTDSTKPTANTKTASLSITVDTPITVTTTSPLPTGYVGLAYSQTLAATGGSGKGYTWAVTSGSTLPGGLTLSAAGVLSGKPTTAGNPSFSVTVTDSASNTGTGTLSITIKAGVSITTGSPLPTGYVGSAYSQTLAATGGSGTGYTWALTSGSTLPAGLTLSAAGVLGGKPTTVGNPSFSVTVTDSLSNTATAAFSMTISAGVSITTGSPLPTGYQGATYPATTFAATGGTGTGYSWTWAAASGSSLPAGLSLSTGGLISGAPSAAGTFSIVVTVTDSALNTASATFSLTVEATLTITTTSPLKTGTAGAAYSQQLAATGGTGAGYTWSTNAAGTSSLAAVGLTLSPAGLVSGGSPSLGSASFTATVTDSASHTASVTFAVTIANLLTVTTATLPAATTGVGYSQTLSAAGGSGTGYTWSVSGTSNLATFNLSLSSAGVISGTPATTGTASFTAKVTDSASNTATQALTIQVYNALALPTPNPSSLGSATVGQFYTGTITASGGSGNYTWTVTGLTDNLSYSSSGATLTVSGTPNTPTVVSFNVSVQDNITLATAANTYTITVNSPPALSLPTPNPTSLGSATVSQSYSGTISASGGVPPYTWTVNGTSVPTSGSSPLSDGLNVSTNAGGNPLAIGGTPSTTGTVTLTNVIVTDSTNATAENTYNIAVNNPAAGYTVSGTVTYGGTQTGQVYLALVNTNCGGCNSNLGTSITKGTALKSGAAFTILGVQPGTYTLQAFMDNLGYGAQNASNPTGSSTSNITVNSSGVSGVSLTLNDPAAVTISSAPTWSSNNGSGAFSGGAFVSFKSIQNNNGIEMPTSYTVGWSTSQSCSSFAGTKSFPATGQNNPWIVTGLTTGQTYYFCAQGVAVGSTGPWSAPSPGVLIEPPTATGNYLVSGSVTFTTPATGPLYVGFYDQNSGNVYVDAVGSKASPPKTGVSYQVYVPAGTNYYFFGVIDQANSGLISAPGQISNTNSNNAASVAITGTTTDENLNLPTVNSTASVRTQAQEQINPGSPSTTNYSIGFQVNGSYKLPVAVELASGPTGVVIPADIATGTFSGSKGGQFSYWTSLNGATPKVGDSYTLDVTYSDTTSDILTVTVSAVLDAFATDLLPQGNGVSVQPNFSWIDPANAGSYTYQFSLCCGPNGTIWQIPSNNSNSNGFGSNITAIQWDVDPTGSGDLPNPTSLNGSTYYSWQIQASDANGNSAQVQVSFETAETPLSLPAPGSVGTTVVGQNFNGAVNASGGVPNYTFTVNGSTVNTNGTPVELGTSNLYVSNTGGNTLSISGTPSGVGVVSFTVAVTDSSNPTQSAGPYTYTITVSAAAALSIETTSMPGGNNGWPYTSSVKATGGVQPYTWSIIGGSLPSNLTTSSNGGSNFNITGTPSGTGTASFTVQVADSESPPVTVSQALTITITSCTYAALNGNYAFVSNGWDSSGSTLGVSAIGSFVANGSGTISSGLIDVSDQANSGPQSGTFAGTYCVGSNNLALISLNYAGGLSGSNTFAAALDASDGNGHLISFDTSNLQVSGLLRKQTTSAFLTSKIDGNYAFGLVGVNQGYNRFGLAGEFTSNGSGSLTGQVDFDTACPNGCGSGNSGNTTISSSDFTVASTGRGTASIFITAPDVTVNFVFYVVSSSEMLMMAYDSTETPPIILAGQVLQQSASLTNASLNGNSVIEVVGVNNVNSQTVADVQAGIINANGSGGFTLSMDENDGGTWDSGTGNPATISGDYSVGSGGRVTLSNIVGGGGGGHPPIFYLVTTNQAFVIDTGSSGTFGKITPQTGSSFTTASFSGNYVGGSEPPVVSDNGEEVDVLNANGTGTTNVISDKNDSNACGGGGTGCGGPGSQTVPGLEYAVSPNGRVVVTCGADSGGNCGPSGTQVAIIYMISDSQVVLLVEQNSNPRLDDFHQ